MTALAAARNTDKRGAHPLPELHHLPMKAGAKVYQGGLVALDAGYIVAASATAGLIVVGRANETVDNTSGSNGTLMCPVEPGQYKYLNSATTDALTAADVGRDCFVVDDQTVARTNSGGTRPVAGRVLGVAADLGVFVAVGLPMSENTLDIMLLASADLSAKKYFAIKVGTTGQAAVAGAGEMACGILQNAPASGAVAIVRVRGVSRMIAGAALANAGVAIASDAAGKAKSAVLSSTNTSDAGGATDALIGSYVLGIALGTAAGDLSEFPVLITHSGAVPTTAA